MADDGHGHDDKAHSTSGASESKTSMPRMDNIFQKVEDYITAGISRFVAFIFLLITLGAVFGYFVSQKEGNTATLLLISPAIVALIAYYNRAFAVGVFFVLVLFIFLL